MKNEKLLDWDHILLLAAIKAIFKHQVIVLKSRKKNKLAKRLRKNSKSLIDLLVEDALLLTPKSLHATFNALLTKDPHYINILDLYQQERPQILSEAQNRQKSIAPLTAYCIGCNFKSGDCDNSSCSYLHCCLLHNDRMQHKTMNCTDNPNRWKKPSQKPTESTRNNKRRGKKPWNNNKYPFNYQDQQQHVHHNQPIFHPQHFMPVQYPQQWQQPPPVLDKKGNRANFFNPPKK